MSIDPKIIEAPARKFMFDRSFDTVSGAPRAVERKPVLMKPEQVDALKKESYDAGFLAGKNAGREEQVSLLSALLGRVEKNIEGLMGNLKAVQNEQDSHVRQLVLAIAKKIVPDLATRHGLQEIDSLLNDAIREMAREPRLVVRVNDSQLDPVNERIKSITKQHAYAGQVIVIADADTAVGDCRIEWADGGIERNTQATWKAVEETIGAETTPEPAAL